MYTQLARSGWGGAYGTGRRLGSLYSSDLARRRSQAQGARILRERGYQVPSWIDLGISTKENTHFFTSFGLGVF